MALSWSDNVRRSALLGGTLAFSLSYTLLMIWDERFRPDYLCLLARDLLLRPIPRRRSRWVEPTALEEAWELSWLLFTTHGLMAFGITWGVVHGAYLAIRKRGSRAIVLGLASWLVICSFVGWTFLANDEYSDWVFAGIPFDVGVLWQYGPHVCSPFWTAFFLPSYFTGMACLLYALLGLALAPQAWLRLLFLFPVIAIVYWVSWNPFFPVTLWSEGR